MCPSGVGSLDAGGGRRFDDVLTGTYELALYTDGSVLTWENLQMPHAGKLELRAPRPTALEGRVVEAGAPERGIAGAFVLVRGSFAGGRRTEIADAGAEGSFTATACPGPNVALKGYAAGHLEASVTTKHPAGEPVLVPLGAACRVRGRLTRTGTGAPLAKVTIVATSPLEHPDATATTDADGRFAFERLPAVVLTMWSASHRLAVAGSMAAPTGTEPTVLPLVGQETILDLQAPEGGRIEGIVIDEAGLPLADAHVRATPEPPEGEGRAVERKPRSLASEQDGRFLFVDLRDDCAYALEAWDPTHPPARVASVVVSALPGALLELRLAAGRFVELVVRDADSQRPVVGARVHDRQDRFALEGDEAAAELVTDAAGQVRVGPVPKGDVEVTLRADGYLRARRTIPAGIEGAIAVNLARGFPVSGRVLRPDGAPAVGAHVRLRMTAEAFGIYRSVGWVQGDTDGTGTFSLPGFPRGPVPLEAEFTFVAPDGRPAPTEVGSTDTEAGATDCVIRLATRQVAARKSLTIRVVDPDGRPVPSVAIEVAGSNWSSGTTAEGGVFVCNLGGEVTGTFDATLDVHVTMPRDAAGRALPLGATTVPVPATQTEVTIRLERSEAIRGIVRNPDGAPAGFLAVSLGSVPRGTTGSEHRIASATTAADGTFELVGAGREPCLVSVVPPRGLLAPTPLDARAGATGLELRLRTAVSAVITVLGPDGPPLPGVKVRVEHELEARVNETVVLRGNGPPPSAVTDTSGRATLAGLDGAKRSTLEVTPSVPTAREHRAEDWAPADTTVRLRRALRIAGVVRDLRGRPVPGASVETSRDDEMSMNETDSSGRFSIDGLEEGAVKLRARPPETERAFDTFEAPLPETGDETPATSDAPEADPWVTVQAGATDVVLTLDLGTTLVVRVEGWSPDEAAAAGGPFSSSPTAVLEPEGPSKPADRRRAAIADDGTARFHRLDPARAYTLFIGPVGQRSLRKAGVRAGADLGVRLEPGKVLALRVVGPAPIRDVTLTFEDCPLPHPLWGKVREDGTVDLRGYPPGRYTVHARYAVNDRQYVGKVAVEAGGPRVDLRVEPDPEGER